MKGMRHLGHRTVDEVSLAGASFEDALHQDRGLVLAWYGLVWVHHHNLVEQWTEDIARTRQQLFDAVEQCRMLEPNGAQTQLVLGLPDMLQGRPTQAVEHLKRATHLNPSSTQALGLLGQCYCLSDEPDEAIAVVEEALILNPYNPNTWAQRGVISLAHFCARRYDLAEQFANRAVADKPNTITPRLVKVASAFEDKRFEDAAEHYHELLHHRPNFEVSHYLGLIAPVVKPMQIQRIVDAFEAVR